MIATTLATMALIGFSSAQSTVPLFIPGADKQSLVGSVVGSSGSATTYAIQCPPGTDQNDCGFPEPVTVVGGPSTVHLAVGMQDFTLDVGCAVSGSTSAVCVESATGSAANYPGVSTTTLAASELSYNPVVITAGAAASGQQSATATSSVTASSTSSGLSTSSTGVAAASGGSSSTPSSMATSTSGKSSSSATSTGSASASTSGGASATAANQTHNAGAVQAVGGSGKGAMGAVVVMLAIAMTML